MGQALRGSAQDGGGGRGALSLRRLVALAATLLSSGTWRAAKAQDAPVRIDIARFTAVCYSGDEKLARNLLAEAAQHDTFPGLPRPQWRVLVAIAPDRARFREWAGPGAPEWGAAVALPESHRIVLQGHDAGSDAGDPREVLRHELAHLALHEYLGDLPPRWFDEGYASYAAREWQRDDALAANFGLALRGTPTFDELETWFSGGETQANAAYALSWRAVADLAALDPQHGLAKFFANWKATGSLDQGVRQTYGITLSDFETRWRSDTRRRYGALALFGDLALLGFIVVIMAGPLWILRRRRDRVRRAALMEADRLAEEREARERDAAIAELLGGFVVPDESSDEGPRTASEGGEGGH